MIDYDKASKPNNDLINIDKNFSNYQQNINNNNNQNPNLPNQSPPVRSIRKNRTLQYYKFLFYSIKLEIKATEFIDLIRFANQSEISLWIVSLVLHQEGYSGFLWFHVLHLVRGLIGFFLLFKFPKSGDVIDQMALNKQDIENNIFNDLARKSVNTRIFEPFKTMKPLLVIYMLMTVINFCIDSLDFFYQLSKFDKKDESLNAKVYLFVNFLIAILYLAIDFCYLFWGYTLNYALPKNLMIPIYDLIGGWVDKFRQTFKLNKTPIDLRNEESNNQSRNEVVNEMKMEMNKNENDKKSNHQNNNAKMVPVSEMNQIRMENHMYRENANYHNPSNY